MLKGLPILCTILILLLLAAPVAATTFVDSLQKRFKKLDHPNDDVTVRITLQTHMTDNTGNQTDKSVLLAYRTHDKLVSVFRNNGWTGDDPLRIDGIDAGEISTFISRLNVFPSIALNIKKIKFQFKDGERIEKIEDEQLASKLAVKNPKDTIFKKI